MLEKKGGGGWLERLKGQLKSRVESYQGKGTRKGGLGGWGTLELLKRTKAIQPLYTLLEGKLKRKDFNKGINDAASLFRIH